MYFYTFKYDYAKRKFECVHQCSNLSEYKDFEAKEDPKEFYVSFSFDTEKNSETLAKERDEQYARGHFYHCKDCGKVTYIKRSYLDWYKHQGLQAPKRCSDCIRRRKAAKTKINL